MQHLGNRRIVVEQVSPPAEEQRVLLSRIGEVDRLSAVLLLAQSDLFAEARNGQLIDALLDIRRALCLPGPGPSVPVVPGRSS